MRYMMMVRTADTAENFQPPQALQEAMGEAVGKELAAGRLVDAGGFDRGPAGGTRVRLRAGGQSTAGGPYVEANQLVGGYAIYNLASDEEAAEVARDFLALHEKHWPGWEGEVEIRRIFGTED